MPTPEQEKTIARYNAEISELKKALEEAKQPERKEEERKSLEQQVKKLEGRRNAIEAEVPKTLVVQRREEPLTMRVLPRGNWLDDSGPVVNPAIPKHLGSLSLEDERRANRLDLAHWITSPDNPLTARVFVNRIWGLLFGQAIARTLEDVGAQGEWPTHPELLDWLALEFVENGWDVKELIRTIVNSRTYQQSSLESPALRQRDPYNRLLARQGRFRLDAEMIRDNALAISDLLVHVRGGGSAKPYQPAGYWAQLNFPKRTYQADHDENQHAVVFTPIGAAPFSTPAWPPSTRPPGKSAPPIACGPTHHSRLSCSSMTLPTSRPRGLSPSGSRLRRAPTPNSASAGLSVRSSRASPPPKKSAF